MAQNKLERLVHKIRRVYDISNIFLPQIMPPVTYSETMRSNLNAET